jgi:hypothetical protein
VTWLVLAWFLTVGAIPEQYGYIDFGDDFLDLAAVETTYTTELGLHAEAFGCLRAWGSAEVYEYYAEGLAFQPFRSDFTIGASVFWGPLELAIEHECDHPVVYKPGLYPQILEVQTAITLTLRGEVRF